MSQRTEIRILFNVFLIYVNGHHLTPPIVTDLFTALNQAEVSTDPVNFVPSVPWGGLSFSVRDWDLANLFRVIAQFKNQYPTLQFSLLGGCSKITLQNNAAQNARDRIYHFFKSLQQSSVEILLVSSSSSSVSALIPDNELDSALHSLKQTFPYAQIIYEDLV